MDGAWRGVAVVMGVGLVVTACATGRHVVEPADVRRAAEAEEAALLKRVKVYDDAGLVAYLTGIGRRLLAARPAGEEVGRFRITVIEDPTLGAFAMPGGSVFVHTGLLSQVVSEGQLAAVLARELGRGSAPAPGQAWKGTMPRAALGPTAAAVLGLDLKLVRGAAMGKDGLEGERGAEAAGWRWLSAAGYEPAEALALFERLARDDPDRAGVLEIFEYGNRARMRQRHQAARRLLPESPPAQDAGGHRVGGAGFERAMRAVVRDNAALDIRAGRFTLARRQLDRVLSVAPDDPIAQTFYGDLHRLQSQGAVGPARDEAARRALERYQRAAELDAGYADVFRQLALLHYQGGDTVAARAAFERYLALKPDAPDAPRVREYVASLPD